MRIIAHRGLWHEIEERNTLASLKSAIDEGFGVETDIRDYRGKLVISHDVANENSIELDTFLEYYRFRKSDAILALNIKADGIQKMLITLLNKYHVTNYFLFDMSIPEFVVNVREGLNCFTRNSDIEKECVLYKEATGVWMDSFYQENWITMEKICLHQTNGKKVCLVSPELHKQSNDSLWGMLKDNLDVLNEDVYLCTDMPELAEVLFNGQ